MAGRVKILVTGASGFLGAYIVNYLRAAGSVIATLRSSSIPKSTEGVEWHYLDITNPLSVNKLFNEEQPDAVVHAAAMAAISSCESDPESAERINVQGTFNVAQAAMMVGAYLILLSTDLVFDGEAAPYDENSKPSPLSVYGRTKLQSEAKCPRNSLILRLALSFGKRIGAGTPTFFDEAINRIGHKEEVFFFHDEWRTPIWAADVARHIPMILERKPEGILHVGGPERMSRLEMGVRACRILGMDSGPIKSVSRLDLPGPPRPRDLSLDNSRFKQLFPNFEFTSFEKAIESSYKKSVPRQSP